MITHQQMVTFHNESLDDEDDEVGPVRQFKDATLNRIYDVVIQALKAEGFAESQVIDVSIIVSKGEVFVEMDLENKTYHFSVDEDDDDDVKVYLQQFVEVCIDFRQDDEQWSLNEDGLPEEMNIELLCG